MSIPETDWKAFKHDRYLGLFRLIRERDKELAAAFDDHSRSKALMQLIAIRRLGVVTEEELKGFSSETQAAVEAVASGF